jgi:hypothetical protein
MYICLRKKFNYLFNMFVCISIKTYCKTYNYKTSIRNNENTRDNQNLKKRSTSINVQYMIYYFFFAGLIIIVIIIDVSKWFRNMNVCIILQVLNNIFGPKIIFSETVKFYIFIMIIEFIVLIMYF